MNNNEFCVLKQNEINEVSGGLIISVLVVISSATMLSGALVAFGWRLDPA